MPLEAVCQNSHSPASNASMAHWCCVGYGRLA